MSELASALRQLSDMSAELRVVNYRLGQVEMSVDRRAPREHVADLRTEQAELREMQRDFGARMKTLEDAVVDRINRRDNLTKIVLALLGSGGLVFLFAQYLLGV